MSMRHKGEEWLNSLKRDLGYLTVLISCELDLFSKRKEKELFLLTSILANIIDEKVDYLKQDQNDLHFCDVFHKSFYSAIKKTYYSSKDRISDSEYISKLTSISDKLYMLKRLSKEELENLRDFCLTLSTYFSLFKEPLKRYTA